MSVSEYFNLDDLSPLSFEKNNNIQSDKDSNKELSFPSTTISSPTLLSKTTTDDSSIASSNKRKYAGTTPKNRQTASSVEISKNESDDESAIIESEANEAMHVLERLVDENIASLKKTKMNSEDTSCDRDVEKYDSDKEIQYPLSQHAASDAKSDNSFVTLDEYHDSDVDMLNNFDSPEINVTHSSMSTIEQLSSQRPLNLADYSSEFVYDKLHFAPENIGSPHESSLKLELFDVSLEEIQSAVGPIIASLESSDEEL